MKNTCNYSDEWQPYIGDYDKYEYDIKLKDGTLIENCYPNGGLFNSISDEHDTQAFDEKEVVEIRFSQRPRYGINDSVSKIKFEETEYGKAQNERINERVKSRGDGGVGMASLLTMATMDTVYEPYLVDNPKNTKGYTGQASRKVRGKITDIRTEPKIDRNSPCACGSGLKYKKCCINDIKGNVTQN